MFSGGQLGEQGGCGAGPVGCARGAAAAFLGGGRPLEHGSPELRGHRHRAGRSALRVRLKLAAAAAEKVADRPVALLCEPRLRYGASRPGSAATRTAGSYLPANSYTRGWAQGPTPVGGLERRHAQEHAVSP